jgi:hypothetical protein
MATVAAPSPQWPSQTTTTAVRLGSSTSCSAEYGAFAISPSGKNVTFKVRTTNRGSVRGPRVSRAKHHHRRTRSDPLQPLSHTKLLSEEINQLQKKKHKLENGTPLSGWNGKEKRKLQEAINSVLEEKRKKQLGKIKRRFVSSPLLSVSPQSLPSQARSRPLSASQNASTGGALQPAVGRGH